jgi:hypothetical protein
MTISSGRGKSFTNLSLFASLAGYWIACKWDFPVVPADVLLLGLLFGVAWVAAKIFRLTIGKQSRECAGSEEPRGKLRRKGKQHNIWREAQLLCIWERSDNVRAVFGSMDALVYVTKNVNFYIIYDVENVFCDIFDDINDVLGQTRATA